MLAYSYTGMVVTHQVRVPRLFPDISLDANKLLIKYFIIMQKCATIINE